MKYKEESCHPSVAERQTCFKCVVKLELLSWSCCIKVVSSTTPISYCMKMLVAAHECSLWRYVPFPPGPYGHVLKSHEDRLLGCRPEMRAQLWSSSHHLAHGQQYTFRSPSSSTSLEYSPLPWGHFCDNRHPSDLVWDYYAHRSSPWWFHHGNVTCHYTEVPHKWKYIPRTRLRWTSQRSFCTNCTDMLNVWIVAVCSTTGHVPSTNQDIILGYDESVKHYQYCIST